MKRISFITICIFSLLICACSTATKTPADMYKGQSEAKIFKAGHQAMLDGDYQEAITHFEAMDARYPFGKYSRKAQLDSIYAYYKNDNTASALAAADRYIHLYPQGPDVDYAYYLRGMIRFNENQSFFEKYFPFDRAKRDTATLKRSYSDFKLLVHYYPRSKYAADSRQRMIFIRNAISRHELEVAKFYYNHKAYVAAANRSNEVVQHYQRTPSVPKALALMVKSYRALKLPQDANEALKVLQASFPNSSELKSVT